MNQPLSASIEVITPDIARRMLARNTKNRKPRSRLVRHYADVMRKGQWRLNGQTIVIGSDETLLDGQHRLMAVVESGCEIEIVVVRGIDKETFITIDTGEVKKAHDALYMEGVQETTVVSAAARVIMGYRVGNVLKRNKVLNSEVLEFVKNNPDLELCAIEASSYGRSVISHPVATAFLFMFKQKHESLAVIFMEQLCMGINLRADSPVYKLRRLLEENMTSVKKFHRDQVSALIVKTWNATRVGTDNVQLRYNKAETLPEIL